MAAWRALNETTPRRPDAAENLSARLDTPKASEADRRLATQLVMGVLRHRARLDFVLARLLDKPLERQREPILNLMRLGAYQALRLDHPSEHAIVHETVEVARLSEFRDASGLVNAVLRNLVRRREELSAPIDTGDAERDFETEYSCPQWIRAMLDEGIGARRWREWWRTAQRVPLLHLRVNRLRAEPEAVIDELNAAGLSASAAPIPDVVVVEGPARPGELPCFLEGRVTVQDAGATLVTRLLDPKPGERVADFCAAPGGKTGHLAALSENRSEILATDTSKRRLDEVPKVAARLGAKRVHCEMANQLLLARYGNWAEAVLVDAPCVGMGTIRRHPEIRWLRERDDVIRASLEQLLILNQAQQLARPGGRLLYCTCSLFYEENMRLIETFLSSARNLRLIDAREVVQGAHGDLDFIVPYLDENGVLFTPLDSSFPLDGFFAALMVKNG